MTSTVWRAIERHVDAELYVQRAHRLRLECRFIRRRGLWSRVTLVTVPAVISASFRRVTPAAGRACWRGRGAELVEAGHRKVA
jgi:hypothetical protein